MITIQVQPSNEFLASCIITAVEGGINYWACCADYKFPGCDDGVDFAEVTVHESVEELDYDGPTIPGSRGGEYKAEGKRVTMADIEAALGKVIDLSVGLALHEAHRIAIKTALMMDDAGMIDADLADHIMQVAVLGDVIYG